MILNRSILVVDDQTSMRAQMVEILRQSRYSVAGQTNNTDDALLKVEMLCPEAVIMDVSLPGYLDALIAMKRIRAQHPDVTIFATGSASQAPLLMESLTMGAVDFFMRPYQRRTVQNSLQRNLG